MALYKLEEYAPEYKDTFEGYDIKGFDVYSDRDNEKVGSVKNILIDEAGRFRYFIVDTGGWIFGKKVLLPVGRARVDDHHRRVYAIGFTKEQAKDLPEFSEDMKIDADYEQRVRGVYYDPARETSVERTLAVEESAPVDVSEPLEGYPMPTAYAEPKARIPERERETFSYQQQPALYNLNEQNHKTLKLYEERLIANKQRVKAGEVTVGKHVETKTAQVAVPVEKERVVIERTTPADAGRAVAPGEANFRDTEVARVEVYEETPDIRKETVVAEEVNIRKEVSQETATATGQVRREELDVDANQPSTVKKIKP